MESTNVAIFIPHNGCPNNCSFCNQRSIVGQTWQPSAGDVISAVEIAKANLGGKSQDTEIAFFGGSFTAIDREYMISLLTAAYAYIKNGDFKGIRISTRPDCIDMEVLNILKNFAVTSIELGAQSLDDEVLEANKRGHSKLDIIKSSELIKKEKFSLGLQMMTGLYKATEEKDYCSAVEILKLKPDTVRIYPTVVLKGTLLENLYLSGEYVPYGLEKSIEICSRLIKLFIKSNIKILRVGLHSSPTLEREAIAGAYHPNFRELCDNKLILDDILKQIDENHLCGNILIKANSKNCPKVVGYKRKNLLILESLNYPVTIKEDISLKDDEIIVTSK